MYDFGNSTSNGYVGEVDRSHKRPRVDEFGSGVFGYENSHQNPVRFSSDDERRLKLIRDHGGVSMGNFPNIYHQDFNASFVRNVEMNNKNNNMYSPFQPNGANQQSYGNHNLQQNQVNDYDLVPAKRPQYYSHMNNNWQWQQHQQYGMPNYMGPADFQSPGRQPIEVNQGSAGHQNFGDPEAYLPRHENRVFSGQPPPPLPASPPPLPVEPPVVHSTSEFKAYPSPPTASLFPVPISSSETNPYLHNKPLQLPHASTGFVSEVLLLGYMLGL